MTRSMRLTFQKGDWIAIVLVALLAAAVAAAFFPADSSGDGVVQIYQDGRLLRELPLDRDGVYTIDGPYRNVVTVSGGRAAITESSCPGADCVHSGWISRTGRSIVCLPNRTEVRIAGAGSGDIDFVVG